MSRGCIHEGEFTGSGTERSDRGPLPGCPPCARMTAVMECEIHDVCVPKGVARDESIKSCQNCNDRIRPGSPEDGTTNTNDCER